MPTSIGVFASRDQAENAVHELLAADVPQDSISLLTPETKTPEHRTTGKKVGAYIGGAIGTSTGLSLGLAAATLAVPGIGPVLGIGLGAAALLGLGGVTAGKSVGHGIDALNEAEHPTDLPDAAFFHDVLRLNRSIIVVQTDSTSTHNRASAVLNRLGLGSEPETPAPMGRVSSRNEGDVLIISLIGRIVAGDPTAAFHELIYQAVELGSRKILVDMTDVTFIDSSGIGELVNAFLRVRNVGGRLKLTRLPEKVRELMHITHLDKVMDIANNHEQAMAAFAS